MNKQIEKPKAYSYLRFSTPEQLKGDSFRRQTSMAQEWALRNGYALDDSLSFRDLGVSAFRGANSDTGRLGDFLEAVRAKQVVTGSLLLVEALDRVSRLVPRKALKILEQIVDEGITLVTLNDGRRYTSETLDEDPISLMVAIMLFMRANEESESKSRRLKQVWGAKRASASEKPLTSVMPAWLNLNRDSGTIETIPERAEMIQRIFRMTLEGHGMETIASTFNLEGSKPWGRASVWYRTYVKKIQESETVLGWYTPHTTSYVGGKLTRTPLEPIKGYYPQIISEEDFQRIQVMKLGNTSPKQRAGTKTRIQSVLAGLAVCPICESTMTRVMKGDPKKAGKPKLVCTKAKAGLGCTYHGASQEQIETAIVRDHEQLIHNIPSNSEDLEKEWEHLQHQLEVTQDALNSTLEAIETKPLKTLLDRLEVLETNRDALREQSRLMADRISHASNLVMERRAKEVLEVLKIQPLDALRANAGLRMLFSSVEVDWARGVLVFNWKHQGTTEITYGMPQQPRGV